MKLATNLRRRGEGGGRTASRGCGPKTRGSAISAVEFRERCPSRLANDRQERQSVVLSYQCYPTLQRTINDCEMRRRLQSFLDDGCMSQLLYDESRLMISIDFHDLKYLI